MVSLKGMCIDQRRERSHGIDRGHKLKLYNQWEMSSENDNFIRQNTKLFNLCRLL